VNVLTLFSYKRTPIPLLSLVVDDEDIEFYTFYFPNTGLTINQIEDNINKFKKLFSRDNVCCNDFLSHIQAFDLDIRDSYDVYDYCIPEIKLSTNDLGRCKRALCSIIDELIDDDYSQQWRRLVSSASLVYSVLHSRGVFCGYRKEFPRYSLQTLTGRSKTTGFNIQGTTSDDNIRSVNDNHEFFICFDWISADICMAAHMSGDKKLLRSFTESDPYTVISDQTGLGRDVCKNSFIRSLYAMNFDNDIFSIFPGFRSWMESRREELRMYDKVDTILGREFVLGDNRELSVFNAQFQGSVVHAMQSVLSRVFDKYPEYILTEVHDALILCCPERVVCNIIDEVGKIMISPLEGLVDIRMPFTISIGGHWKDWVKVRTCR